jgi:hypothetical protein
MYVTRVRGECDIICNTCPVVHSIPSLLEYDISATRVQWSVFYFIHNVLFNVLLVLSHLSLSVVGCHIAEGAQVFLCHCERCHCERCHCERCHCERCHPNELSILHTTVVFHNYFVICI